MIELLPQFELREPPGGASPRRAADDGFADALRRENRQPKAGRAERAAAADDDVPTHRHDEQKASKAREDASSREADDQPRTGDVPDATSDGEAAEGEKDATTAQSAAGQTQVDGASTPLAADRPGGAASPEATGLGATAALNPAQVHSRVPVRAEWASIRCEAAVR
ncbi:MAG: hypothetical protein WD009_14840, partial [Phycisphaeraceae bacterium]